MDRPSDRANNGTVIQRGRLGSGKAQGARERGSLDTEPGESAAGGTIVSDGSLSLGGPPKFQDGMK